MNLNINKTVLVAPLDWGLGHSTRCIPIIRYLLHKGWRVVLAAEGAQAQLLQQEFPSITILPLTGYRISYSKSKRWFAVKIFTQLPKILRSIRREHNWLKKAVKDQQIDIVISDNRYGLYHAGITSIIITHQLQVKAPFQWLENFIRKNLYRYIDCFSQCWVPDAAGEVNIGGQLSHPNVLPTIPVHYIGPLSRMELSESSYENDILILLSGPEPQRSIFEKILIAQLPGCRKKIVMVRGLPSTKDTLQLQGVVVINHLPASQLQHLMVNSKFIICRSGYSTLMDLCALQKSAILVPTPGQTEQEYLGNYLAAKGYCLQIEQQDFDLQEAIALAGKHTLRLPPLAMNDFEDLIDKILLAGRL